MNRGLRAGYPGETTKIRLASVTPNDRDVSRPLCTQILPQYLGDGEMELIS